MASDSTHMIEGLGKLFISPAVYCEVPPAGRVWSSIITMVKGFAAEVEILLDRIEQDELSPAEIERSGVWNLRYQLSIVVEAASGTYGQWHLFTVDFVLSFHHGELLRQLIVLRPQRG